MKAGTKLRMKAGTKLRCIDSYQTDLVLGKVYEFASDDGDYYHLRSEFGTIGGYYPERFKVVGCPCALKNCVAKHE